MMPTEYGNYFYRYFTLFLVSMCSSNWVSTDEIKIRGNATHINTFNHVIHTTNAIPCVGESYSGVAAALIWLVLVLIAVATAGGNFLVILAVLLVKKLQTPSNFLIVSLAFSDLLVGILVLPFTIIDALKGYWPFNEGLCDMYISFDVLLCTSSILNLCAISIDRYLVITRPLTYVNSRTPCRMAQMIAAAWIISALISIPPNFGWKPPFEKCKCEYSKNVGYQIYATFCAFYLPLIVMIVLYGKIFKLARQMSRAEQRQLMPSTPEEPECDNKQQQRDLEGNVPGTADQRTSTDSSTAMPDPTNSTHLPRLPEIKMINGKTLLKRKRSSKDSSATGSEHLMTANAKQSSIDIHRRRSKANSDSKVIKTLGVIMGCFCLCWLPFFIVQLLLALLTASGYNTENMIPLTLFRFLQWLGYINSCFNPIIYAKFNREFRQPFKMILLCQCRNINARLRSLAFSTQFGLPRQSTRRSTWFNSSSSRTSRTRPLSGQSIAQRNAEHPTRPRVHVQTDN